MDINLITLSSEDFAAPIVMTTPQVAVAFDRLGIAFGFGDATIADLAIRYGYSSEALCAICSVLCNQSVSVDNLSRSSVSTLLVFLRKSHCHFNAIQIPAMRNLMLRLSKELASGYGQMLVRFFDEYLSEVCEHFAYEETVVFPYINSLIERSVMQDYSVVEFINHHTDIEHALLDLKSILVKHIPETVVSPLRLELVVSLAITERDLHWHTVIEEEILVPLALRIESENREAQCLD